MLRRCRVDGARYPVKSSFGSYEYVQIDRKHQSPSSPSFVWHGRIVGVPRGSLGTLRELASCWMPHRQVLHRKSCEGEGRSWDLGDEVQRHLRDRTRHRLVQSHPILSPLWEEYHLCNRWLAVRLIDSATGWDWNHARRLAELCSFLRGRGLCAEVLDRPWGGRYPRDSSS